ncbi:type IV toxin-antitoxin system AbiEi family antitoxin domain-containing protein [Streptomyces scabiei]|uniref:type IV toxin-antitoxin system AbiEi family antitoxin domain-containing protein n=1 Tax=Streptomyces scabiei TaxID=1930 RepID=UPI00099D6D18|nr:type IV toxin-antitoxin system AbiEi family antitoxin domain-containing protein [Streptomyces scabiei]MDX2835412.1 type IV toxin-antitoxin system AbiEi family antitoxin domain-containing protein [Streptomyces scabiei]MDX3680540.1 type IV toxin-antitoxin system AbiEi family antitoxin domain-containing protein [Streptomyces scabiei]
MDRAEQLAVLSGAAADQWGLVTTAQAKELGLNAVQLLRLTEAGLLENVSRGVYFLSTSGMPQHLDIKAAWLRLQPGEFAWNRPPGYRDSGVISHASACQLHELGDIPAPSVEITVPRRRTTNEPFVRLRTAPLDPTEITVVDGLPVTTATRTITDLLKAKADGGHVGGVIAEAERRDLIVVDDLAEHLQPYARRYGLKATTTGRDLIDHLVTQAGESLRRQEVDRASQEGFDAAVHLLAEHPDLATALAHSRPRNIKERQDEIAALLGVRLADLGRPPHASTIATGKAAVLKALEGMDRQLNKPSPAMEEALRKLRQPSPALTEALRTLKQLDPAVVRSLRQAGALSPAIRRALKSAADPATVRQLPPAPAPVGEQDGDLGDNQPDGADAD